jgi:outer membrane protein assembly factor BamE (lipoprotein component of BamABCDE complex)
MAGIARMALVLGMAVATAGCLRSIETHRGYLADEVLMQSVQPGVDNRISVERTLGQPSYVSQFGEPVWYYIGSTLRQAPFARPKIGEHSVLAVHFDPAGNVIDVNRSGMEQVAFINPENDSTPTLGRERSFFEDLFGNIGTVGTAAPGGGA